MGTATSIRFRGEFAQRVDDKARLAIPSAYRTALEVAGDKQLILVRSVLGRCIAAWPLRDWQAYEDKILALPPSDPTVMKLLRFQVSGNTLVEPDSHGRVVLPPTLRQYARIEPSAEVMVVSTGNRFEVWAKELWGADQLDIEADIENWRTDLPRLGL